MEEYFLSYEDIDRAKENGISYDNLYNRVMNLGWDKERAITTSLRRKEPKYTKKDIELALKNGISKDAFISRVYHSKWTVKEATRIPMNMRRKDYYDKLNSVEETTEECMPCAWCGCGLIPVSEGFCSIECFKENESANRE